ncbi:MAG: hypothetical protein JWN56_980 [Sphingobacteriales bacterium]|nr:hypothetical protein [Sphingobacteriales bacterium]
MKHNKILMKNLILNLLVLLSAVGLSTCSKNEPVEPIVANSELKTAATTLPGKLRNTKCEKEEFEANATAYNTDKSTWTYKNCTCKDGSEGKETSAPVLACKKGGFFDIYDYVWANEGTKVIIVDCEKK